MSINEILATVNSNPAVTLDKLILGYFGNSNLKTVTITENTTFKVPDYTCQLIVTACGGGGGGAYAYNSNYDGGGGGGAACVKDQVIQVQPGENISITIGQGGTGGETSSSTGTDGTNTIIGNYLTLAGGKAPNRQDYAGQKGGDGGGNGGSQRDNTQSEAGLIGAGGANYGGGGSYGNGGATAKSSVLAEAGGYGAGGGGGHRGTGTDYQKGAAGGNGIVILTYSEGYSPIKSIQRGTVSNTKGSSTVTVSISPVNPLKCFVYIKDDCNNQQSFTHGDNTSYGLYNTFCSITNFTENSITFSLSRTKDSSSSSVRYAVATAQYQIIEFN